MRPIAQRAEHINMDQADPCVRACVCALPGVETNAASKSDVFPPTATKLKPHHGRKAAVTHGRLSLVFVKQILRGDESRTK